MGSNQSTPNDAQRAITDRLRNLELQEKEQATNSDGFVEVDHSGPDGTLDEKALGVLRLSSTTLDVAQLENWQSKLLQDPKNR